MNNYEVVDGSEIFSNQTSIQDRTFYMAILLLGTAKDGSISGWPALPLGALLGAAFTASIETLMLRMTGDIQNYHNITPHAKAEIIRSAEVGAAIGSILSLHKAFQK